MSETATDVVREILIDEYGEHQECEAECTDAFMEDLHAQQVAERIVRALQP